MHTQPAFPGYSKVDEKGVVQHVISPLAKRKIITEFEFISFENFKSIFQEKSGTHWTQVEILFREYGPVLSVPLVSALMYAQEDNKLDWCLELLEKHLKEDLHYQHPDARGRVIIGDATQNRSCLFIEEKIIKVLRPEFFV